MAQRAKLLGTKFRDPCQVVAAGGQKQILEALSEDKVACPKKKPKPKPTEVSEPVQAKTEQE